MESVIDLTPFAVVLNPLNLLYLIAGFVVGFIFGVIPGLTATQAIALSLPLSFKMNPIQALIYIAGIYAGGQYSDTITGILINVPGTPAAVIPSREGYLLARKGYLAKAMAWAGFATAIGGLIGTTLLFSALPYLAQIVYVFTTADKASLILFAIVLAALSAKHPVKGAVAALLGMLFGMMGVDPVVPRTRLIFSVVGLSQGVNLITAVIGVFAVSEVLKQVIAWREEYSVPRMKIRLKDFLLSPKEIVSFISQYIKGSLIGLFIGALPGCGAAMATQVAYAEGASRSKRREEYGTGSVEALVYTHAAIGGLPPGALIPMLTFGIPGDSVTAVILGAFLIHGLIPGPTLFSEKMHIVMPMLAAFPIAFVLCYLTVPIFGPFVSKVIEVRKVFLYPFIMLISLTGLWVMTYSPTQLVLCVILGVISYLIERWGASTISFFMGYMLAPQFEYLFRIAWMTGGAEVFIKSPPSALFLLLTAAYIVYVVMKSGRRRS
jgi:putative tricarboxylic transport membrane protein